MNSTIYTTIIVLLILAGCGDAERELQKSVFIEDPDAPELPLYTEWGYNTFGAYYDRTVFRSNSVDTPVKIIAYNGNTSFILQGNRKAGTYESTNAVIFDVILPEFYPNTYSDLLALHATTFDLTDPTIAVFITLDGETFQPEILEGEIKFIRAQSLVVDENPMEVILSGKFQLKFIHDNVGVTISDGRFDVGVGEINFFKQ
jgi:hypothetical protein